MKPLTLQEQLDAMLPSAPTTVSFDPAKAAAGIATLAMMCGKLSFTPRTVGAIFLLTQTELKFSWTVQR